MKFGVSLIALLAAGLLSAAPGASARPSASARGSAVVFISPHAVAHSRPVFAGSSRSSRVIVVHRRFAPPIPPRRPFFAHHRPGVERLILFPTSTFTTPVLVVVRPVCCG
jgi:hypothetical protein